MLIISQESDSIFSKHFFINFSRTMWNHDHESHSSWIQSSFLVLCTQCGWYTYLYLWSAYWHTIMMLTISFLFNITSHGWNGCIFWVVTAWVNDGSSLVIIRYGWTIRYLYPKLNYIFLLLKLMDTLYHIFNKNVYKIDDSTQPVDLEENLTHWLPYICHCHY